MFHTALCHSRSSVPFKCLLGLRQYLFENCYVQFPLGRLAGQHYLLAPEAYFQADLFMPDDISTVSTVALKGAPSPEVCS